MGDNDFVCDYVNLMYYKYHKRNFKFCGTYNDSMDQLKKKKPTINLENDDGRCFQYAVTIVLDYEEIGKKPSKNNKPLSFYM